MELRFQTCLPVSRPVQLKQDEESLSAFAWGSRKSRCECFEGNMIVICEFSTHDGLLYFASEEIVLKGAAYY